MKEHIYQRKINYYETDQMGIVHHSNYIRYFEEARCAWMEANDLPYKKLEEYGVMLPVIGVYCEYKSPAKFADEAEVKVTGSELKGVRMTVSYEMRVKDTLIATRIYQALLCG